MKLVFKLFLLLFICNAVSAEMTAEKQNYILQCQGCHQADGTGSIANKSTPDFREYMAEFLSVPGGREYLVRVPGSFNAPLTEEELAGVLNWIMTNLLADKVPEAFKLYTAEEVKRLKQETLINVAEKRAELVKLVHEMGLKKN